MGRLGPAWISMAIDREPHLSCVAAYRVLKECRHRDKWQISGNTRAFCPDRPASRNDHFPGYNPGHWPMRAEPSVAKFRVGVRGSALQLAISGDGSPCRCFRGQGVREAYTSGANLLQRRLFSCSSAQGARAEQVTQNPVSQELRPRCRVLGGDYFRLADDMAGTLTCHFLERRLPP
jgi:hypothetical protein